jgi:hypothetical protein
MSMPIQRRESFPAAWTVVPQPQQGSRTRSPSFEEAEMMRSSSASGFWWDSRGFPFPLLV